MNNQASIREFFGKLKTASSSNAPLPWELLHTSAASAGRMVNVQGVVTTSRSSATQNGDFGVGLPPMAG